MAGTITVGELLSDPTSGNKITIGSGTTLDLAGSAGSVTGAGKVLQVVSTNYAPSYSSSASSWTDVSGFSVNITPVSSSSKVKVELMCQLGANNWSGLNVVRKEAGQADVILNVGSDSLGSKKASSFGSMSIPDWQSQQSIPFGLVFLDSPLTTNALTYQVQVVARWGSTANTVYINRPSSWNDDAISGRVTASNIIVSEIGV